MAAQEAKKDAIQEAEIQEQTNLRNVFIGGSVLLLLLVLNTFRTLSIKRKANKLLTTQKNEIEKQSKALEAMNQELKESNATKDKFFSIVSHDLKGPFNAIIGLSKLLEESHNEFDDEKREEVIKMLVDSSTHAFNFSENLLKWSMTQIGGVTFQPTQLDSKSIISNTFDLVDNAAKNKKISLIDNSKESLAVYADKDQIEMVLRNLISNSIKFTRENGSITVNAEQGERETIFSVSDTGIGISKENIEKLFDLNNKVNTVGTNDEKGTGLGLIICKEFVEMHNGKIWVSSEINKGSNFHFTVPREIKKEAA